MKTQAMAPSLDKLPENVYRQLELIIKLLGIIATDKDFTSHTQERQIATLGKLGFRNKELSSIFGIKRQQVTNALRKYRSKRR